MIKPKISVIIPIYNDEKYLEECLNSVVEQTFKDFECICVDDCSTDKSPEIINNFIQKDKRIKYIRHDTNQGVSNSRYTGLLQAKADWIAFIDHDDIVSKKYLEFLYKQIDENNEIDVVVCDHADLDKNLHFDENDICEIFCYETKQFIEKNRNEANIFVYDMWAKIIKRDILLKIDCIKYKNEFPWCWFEDTFVMFSCYLICKKMIVIGNILYGYRVHEESLSHTPHNVRYYEDRARCDCVIMNTLIEYKLYTKAYKVYEGMLLGYMKEAYLSLKDEKYIKHHDKIIQEFKDAYSERKYIHKTMNIITRINTAVYFRNPTLWEKTIGYFYFDFSIKFPKLNKFFSTLR